MGMNIAFNTDELSDTDKAALRVITGGGSGTESQAAELAARVEAAKPTPAKKAAAAPKAAAVVEPEPEPEPEVESGGQTVDDAVKLASALLSAGKQSDIKAALTDIGVKRVSEMTDEQAPVFIAALSGLL